MLFRWGKLSLFVQEPSLLFSLSGTYYYLDVGLFLGNCLPLPTLEKSVTIPTPDLMLISKCSLFVGKRQSLLPKEEARREGGGGWK